MGDGGGIAVEAKASKFYSPLSVCPPNTFSRLIARDYPNTYLIMLDKESKPLCLN